MLKAMTPPASSLSSTAASLPRQEMDGHGVRAERIDHQHVERPRRLSTSAMRARRARSRAGGAVRQIGELPGIAGEVGNRRIDLEERPVLARLAVRGERADAEADDADSVPVVPSLERREDLADRSRLWQYVDGSRRLPASRC